MTHVRVVLFKRRVKIFFTLIYIASGVFIDYLEQLTWTLMGILCFVPTSFLFSPLCAEEKMQLRSLLDKTSVQPLRKFRRSVQ